MINVYAQTFMTATRTGCVPMRDYNPGPREKRLNWFARRKTHCVDPAKL